MRNMRILRLLAGQIKSPSERALDRQERRDRRELAQLKRSLEFAELMQRRERGDPDLPPMPFDFAEQAKRREGKS